MFGPALSKGVVIAFANTHVLQYPVGQVVGCRDLVTWYL